MTGSRLVRLSMHISVFVGSVPCECATACCMASGSQTMLTSGDATLLIVISVFHFAIGALDPFGLLCRSLVAASSNILSLDQILLSA